MPRINMLLVGTDIAEYNAVHELVEMADRLASNFLMKFAGNCYGDQRYIYSQGDLKSSSTTATWTSGSLE